MMDVTPYAAAQFVSYRLPSYFEQVVSGANTFALAYNGKDVTASRSELGIRTEKSFAQESDSVLTLRSRLAWAPDFNTDRKGTGGVRDAARLGLHGQRRAGVRRHGADLALGRTRLAQRLGGERHLRRPVPRHHQ